jgi:pterin-4a-carbinolamine dehydratase
VREIEFRDFSDAIAFFERIASVEDHLRRPDMCILSYNRVRLTIANPHHAGLTAAESRLAEKLNHLIDRNSPESKAARRASP